jgi:hypothetical protein
VVNGGCRDCQMPLNAKVGGSLVLPRIDKAELGCLALRSAIEFDMSALLLLCLPVLYYTISSGCVA